MPRIDASHPGGARSIQGERPDGARNRYKRAGRKGQKYFEEQKYSFSNLLGSGSDVIKNYGANSIPRVVLIDKDGVVRYVHGGWGPGQDITPEVKKLIEP
jgi:hypothetical protein